MSRFLALISVAGALLAVALPAHAAPDEIQVYTDEIDAPGESGVEMHINWVPSGRRLASYPGEMPSARRLQVTPEFSYGLTKSLEAGLYLPFSNDPQHGGTLSNGVRVRLKYIHPREDGDRFFWGLNGELGWYANRTNESRMAMELRPIMGWRDGAWLFVLNPIVDVDLSGNVSNRPSFDPAVKVGRHVSDSTMIGLESYRSYGPFGAFNGAGDRPTYVYATLDTELGKMGVNVGVGRGFQGAEDRWVVKAIVALPF